MTVFGPPLKVFVQLEETHTILDTTVCVPRRSFFLEEARSLFKSVVCTLSSVGDLEHYWYQLQSVCLRTPIILGETPLLHLLYQEPT